MVIIILLLGKQFGRKVLNGLKTIKFKKGSLRQYFLSKYKYFQGNKTGKIVERDTEMTSLNRTKLSTSICSNINETNTVFKDIVPTGLKI